MRPVKIVGITKEGARWIVKLDREIGVRYETRDFLWFNDGRDQTLRDELSVYIYAVDFLAAHLRYKVVTDD